MSVNKYVIFFDEKEYNEQQERFELYQEAAASLKDEITALVGHIDIDYDNPMLSVREAFLKKYEDKNTIGLYSAILVCDGEICDTSNFVKE